MKLIFIILLLLFVQLNAADINATLINANKDVYVKLLKTLNKSATRKNEQTLLQVALLEKLISTSKPFKQTQSSFNVAKNAKEAQQLLFKWFDLLDKITTLQTKQKSLQSKKATLENEITNALKTDPLLSTYQLQYALYQKNISFLIKKLALLKEERQSTEKTIIKIPKTVLLKQEILRKQEQKYLQELSFRNKLLKELQIKKERIELLENPIELTRVEKNITSQELKQQQISQYLIATDFLIFCNELQQKKHTAFTYKQKIMQLEKDDVTRDALDNLLSTMEQKYLGIIYTLGGATEQTVKNSAQSIWNLLSNPLFQINNTPISILKLLWVIFIILFGFIFGVLFKRKVLKVKSSDDETDSVERSSYSARMIISNIGYYLIIIIAFFSSLKVVGINLSSLAVVAGALSVGIGFGLQNIVSNFVSGLILMFERSVKIGDYIQINDDMRGRVTDIRMRSTTIKTNANIDIIIPNQDFIQNNVINWTMTDNIKRFEIPFGVKYGTNPQQVIDVILKAVQESGFQEIYTSRTRYTNVIMTEMGDSSVNFNLFVWIKGREILKPKRTTSKFLILIYNTLNEHNIEIPFPQVDLHVRSIEAALPIINRDKIQEQGKS
ncbi:Potassium efflux system KefA protein / Small-conductance mechanosensitive channel [hydrothermal vent metagenome]|uniref:Potassium efflux system KefA protein / Small-conductance mechanosensitive channel n=1 Tax=hydrothermal vent metagenome TaxID=652676 RepID=A0A1W1BLW6_9ZZZZ